jgi:radical SAM-linked protein
MVQRPARDVEPDRVVEAVTKGVEQTGYNEFSLLSLSCSDWLSLPSVGLRLKNELQEHNISLSLGSQRVDRFDENIARVAGGLRKSGLTFAPEAGTQRMRDAINKGLTDAELLRGVKTAYDQGWSAVKLYFLIGLPGETDADVLGIANTIRFLQKKCRAAGRRRLALTVTVSNLTPKPWTPYQWHTVSAEEFRRKQNLLKREFQFVRDVKINFTDTRLSSMEEFIGRGDRRMSAVIARAHELGAGLDGWFDSTQTAYGAWCQAIEDCGLTWKYRRAEVGEWNIAEMEPEKVRGTRGWYEVARSENRDQKTLAPKEDGTIESKSPLDAVLPWDHIDVGLSKGWLRDELMRSLNGALTPDCAFNDCSQCGCCGDEFGNNITIPAPAIPKYLGERSPPSHRAQRIRLGFARHGAMSMSSHLDTARMMDRLLRRARLPISFNEGFHPHPRIVTSSALPFGATADGELIDFFLHTSVSVGEFAKRVDDELPDGMRVSSATELDVVATTTSVLMESADYALALHRDVDGTPKQVDWENVIAQVLASGRVEVEKTTKRGATTTRDLRSMLLDVRLATAVEAAPVLAHVGAAEWPVDAGVLFARLVLTNQGALSPDGFVRLVQIATGNEELTLLHAHRSRINLREDERYARVNLIRQFEHTRRDMKAKVNRWTRIRMAGSGLNDVWHQP